MTGPQMMTPEAKAQLSSTIRALRTFLLGDPRADGAKTGALHAAVESAYLMGVAASAANLSEVPRIRRQRLEAWIDEQVRTETAATTGEKSKGAKKDADIAALRARFRADAEKQAAYTLINRLVILRLMEATGLRGPAVVTKGKDSAGYTAFLQLAPVLRNNDDHEGYAFLLQLVFDDLAVDLPGLFGSAGIADLVPISAATLQHVVKALDDEGLASCWTDDMTLGWVYQYWNDPEREALDAKLNGGGKVEPHEIASKTQMFTERYMVDWLLQNSLGPMWLAMCQKHGWNADVVKDGVLDALEARRVDWRAKRDAQEVSLTALMPLHSDVERRWAYFLPQPIPDDAVTSAPESVRTLKLLDPAVGSGHFLVVAFELLFALYQEEARHRGLDKHASWRPKAIVESILENNLHGIDLDPRAVQIAAAALWMKAKRSSKDAAPRHLNLVGSALRLAHLPDSDPALVQLRQQVEADTGIPGALTDTVVHALRGADHLGSLLKVDGAVDDAIRTWERGAPSADKPVQGGLFGGPAPQQLRIDAETARKSVLDSLETFLDRHTRSDQLGLRLHGEQLATGVRFVRMLKEGSYDLVVGNPPYQGTAKMKDASYVAKHYPRGKADLFAAFLERGLQLVRDGGSSSMVTMRNWMFLKQFALFRSWIINVCDLRGIGDVSWGAFEDMRDNPAALSVIRRAKSSSSSVAIDPGNAQLRVRTTEELSRKRAGLLAHSGRRVFDVASFVAIPGRPFIYWWSKSQFDLYRDYPTLGSKYAVRQGMATSDNERFLRRPWEVHYFWRALGVNAVSLLSPWQPYIKGAEGRDWFEPLSELVRWSCNAMEIKLMERDGKQTSRPQNEHFYFRPGVAFSSTGTCCRARMHRFPSVFDIKGQSVFAESSIAICCMMNSTHSQAILAALNPSISFQVGDATRLPLVPISSTSDILAVMKEAFERTESHREGSVEFLQPGPSAWLGAQEWGQKAVDRPPSEALTPYVEALRTELATDHLSFALGVALGRFDRAGAGIRDPDKDDLSKALPAGICFLDGTRDDTDFPDSLGHPACELLHTKWKSHGLIDDPPLRTWLRTKFFPDIHKGMYENRPIHWPLSSKSKTFVAFVNIHRMNSDTLRILSADHLQPTKKRLDGELADLRKVRDGADKKAAKSAEKRFAQVQKALEELTQFITDVEACAERGAPPTDAGCKPREKDARYNPDLDDGVMINSAALWPLLEPQWKDPKKWWKELSNAQGKKDYDWSHLAMKYWPTRVDEKCKADPSLGVAHSCFWRYHPARAWAWELRLQDEIGPEFRIEEKPYDPFLTGNQNDDTGDAAHRARYLKENPKEAIDAIEKEVRRRLRKQKKPQTTMTLLDAGLWTAESAKMWALEVSVTEDQGAELHILAPDEAAARAAFIKENPTEAAKREQMVKTLQPLTLLPDEEDEDEAGNVDDEDADADEEGAAE